MSFDPRKTPVFMLPPVQSDAEEANIPARGTTNTQAFHASHPTSPQGVTATSANFKCSYSGIDPIFVSGYRWF